MKKKRKKKNKFSWPAIGRMILVGCLIWANIGTVGFFVVERFKKYEYMTVKTPSKMERKISKMVAGQPIAEMTPYIAQKEKEVAAYLVAIAKKESNWGKFAPKKDNENCYNYWGYRGDYNQTNAGYSCFDSPQQAVNVVGKRIGDLVDKKIDTPRKMVLVWKCGWDCSGHDPDSVIKWANDVDYYYKKVYN